MDQLDEKGFISDPKTKNKSVRLSEEGVRLSEKYYRSLFEVK
jgi:predicted transcriptional regulator